MSSVTVTGLQPSTECKAGKTDEQSIGESDQKLANLVLVRPMSKAVTTRSASHG
jgi:hypothetical protein